MKDFNDKFSGCVLTDEDLASVSGGVSGNEKRTIIVCPLCHDERTYENIREVCYDIGPHYKHLCELGLFDGSTNGITNYAYRLWDAAAPVEE